MNAEAFITPRGSISNRRFIERMQEWGWRVQRVNGDDTVMVAGRDDQFRVVVRSAHCSKGNAPSIFKEVLTIMGGMSWEEFVTSSLAAQNTEAVEFGLDYLKRLRERIENQSIAVQRKREREARKQREREEAMRKAQEAARRAKPAPPPQDTHDGQQAAQAPEEAVQQPVLAIVTDPPAVPRRPRDRGHAEKVFDVLVETGTPLSLGALTRATGLDREQVGRAAVNLVNAGVVTRTKKGVYQITEEAKRQDVRVDVIARSGPPLPAGDSPKIDPNGGTQVEALVTSPGVPLPSPPDVDETITEVLDLLFPGGFKAKHLPLIDTWRRATRELLGEIYRADAGDDE